MNTKQIRFLILRGGAIGDFVVTLPVFQAVRKQWPDAYIELVGYPHIANLALAGDLVDHVESLDRADMAKFFTFTPSFTEEQGKYIRSFDVVLTYLYDPIETMRENLRAAGARQIIYGSPMVTEGHVSDQLFRSLETLAIYGNQAVPQLNMSKGCLDRGREHLAERGLSEKVVAIHPGSGSPKKNWPLDRYLELAIWLEEHSNKPLLILGEADKAIAEDLRRHENKIPVLAGASLVDVGSVLSHCRAYIGNDSGITHLAAALGIPTLAIFGPSDADQWCPRGENVHLTVAPDGNLDRVSVQQITKIIEEAIADSG